MLNLDECGKMADKTSKSHKKQVILA